MRRKNICLLILFLVSVFLRLWKLGGIPEGLSLREVNWGISLSRVFGEWMMNPFIVRLPFSLI